MQIQFKATITHIGNSKFKKGDEMLVSYDEDTAPVAVRDNGQLVFDFIKDVPRET